MDNKRLHKILQGKMLDHEEFLEEDLLWNDIQKKKKKNRGVIFWLKFGAPLLLAGFMFGMYYFNSTDSEKLISKSSVPKYSKEEIVVEKKIKKGEYEVSASTSVDASLKPKPKPNTNTNVSTGISATLGANTKTKTAIIENSIDRNIIKKPANSIGNYVQGNLAEESILDLNRSKSQEGTDIVEEKIEENNLEQKAELNFEFAKAIDFQSLAPLSMENENDNILPALNHQRIKIEKEIAEKEKRKPSFSIGAVSSYSFINKSLEGDSDVDDYVSIRNTIERPLEDIGIGITMSYKMKGGIYIKGGVEWQRLEEEIRTEENLTNTIVEADVLVYELLLLDNTIQPQFGEAEVVYDTLRVYKVYNDHIRVSIPIGLGYEYNLGNWAIQTDLNARFNLSHNFDGYFLNEDQQIVKDADAFKERLEVIPFASLGVKYKWKNGFSFSLNPYLELKKWQVNKSTFPVDQKYQLYGLRTSLQYEF